MVCLNLAGLGGRNLKMQRLSSVFSSANSDRWRRAAADHVRQSTACLLSATSLAFTLGAICTLYKVSIIWGFLNHLDLLMILHLCCFQVFHLTSIVVKGSAVSHPIVTVSLDGVAIDHEKVIGAVASVQDFVRHPLFIQRRFFSETGINMLNTAVAAADAGRHNSEFAFWRAIGVKAGPEIVDLKSCLEKVLLRRKTVTDTRERSFGAHNVASSTFGEAEPRARLSVYLMMLKWGTSSISTNTINVV